jgi:hypothetical protein
MPCVLNQRCRKTPSVVEAEGVFFGLKKEKL